MRLKSRTFLLNLPVIATLAVTGSACGDAPVAAPDREKSKTCVEAESRYQENFPNADSSGVHVVLLYKYTFCPGTLTVKKGETVRWINVDKRTSHSVWLKEAGVEESERFFPDEQWEYTFESAGSFHYLCGPHWESDNMQGDIVVTD